MRKTSLLLAMCVLSVAVIAQEGAPKGPAAAAAVEYICPMYCTDDVSSTPAKCRICGMDMVDRQIVEHPKDYRIVAPRDALTKIKADGTIVLLDVRSKSEYNDELGHLDHSILIPIDELEARAGELEQSRSRTIFVYCSHGIRSARAAKLLTKDGFSVFSIMGGLTKWNQDGLPVVRQ